MVIHKSGNRTISGQYLEGAIMDSGNGLKTPITVAYGDGIGPEIMSAALRVLTEAGARVEFETIEIGKAVYERGFS